MNLEKVPVEFLDEIEFIRILQPVNQRLGIVKDKKAVVLPQIHIVVKELPIRGIDNDGRIQVVEDVAKNIPVKPNA